MKPYFSIFKPTRSPFWYIQWIDEDGRKRQKSTRCEDRGGALKHLSDFQQFSKEKTKPVLFSQFGEQFKSANIGVLSAGTLEIYKFAFCNFLRIIGDISLNRITPQHWDRFKGGRLQECSAVTVNIELRSLRAALSTAVRWKMIDTNPFSRQSLCKVPEKDAPFLTQEQFKLIVPLIRNEDARDVAEIAFFTGMRRGEVLSLLWSNVDLNSSILFVRNTGPFKTKTGKQRGIPLNSGVLAVLKRRRKQITEECDDVFPKLKDALVSKHFKSAARLVLGKDTSIHFHSLRHSFCSNLIRAGANIRVVQSLAGHSSIATTEKYLHNVTTDARNAVELLSMN